MPITLEDVRAAHARIRDGVEATPFSPSAALSSLTGCQVWVKPDNQQRTGSFKERGARNALLQLDAAARAQGVIAASAGNHALGLAFHGGLLGIPVTVVMPRTAPLIKAETCRRFGARVIQHGDNFREAGEEAHRLAAGESLTYVNGYDDPAVIAGQGTVGLELLEACPQLEAVIVPIGGGGLIAGVALAVKSLRPEVQVLGVEGDHVASWHAAVRAGRPVRTEPLPSLADGLAVPEVGANAFALARDRVDGLGLVTERDIALAILRALELEKTVVEGAAATSLAALMAGCFPDLRGRVVGLLFCGGNIDPTVLGRVIHKGLAADGRLVRFTALISDRPGGLARLAARLAEMGAGIVDVTHDRAFSGPDVFAVRVVVTAETRDAGHARDLLARLREDGLECAALDGFAPPPVGP
jgi:threonine dehydratase